MSYLRIVAIHIAMSCAHHAYHMDIIISERAKRASSVPVHVNRDFRYIYIYMWPYVNLYAHAREIIAKKRP